MPTFTNQLKIVLSMFMTSLVLGAISYTSPLQAQGAPERPDMLVEVLTSELVVLVQNDKLEGVPGITVVLTREASADSIEAVTDNQGMAMITDIVLSAPETAKISLKAGKSFLSFLDVLIRPGRSLLSIQL